MLTEGKLIVFYPFLAAQFKHHCVAHHIQGSVIFSCIRHRKCNRGNLYPLVQTGLKVNAEVKPALAGCSGNSRNNNYYRDHHHIKPKFGKSYYFGHRILQPILSFFAFNCSTPKSNTSRDTNSAVNIELTIPTARVLAKPCTGPDPNCESTRAAINVVILASIIVQKALRKPAFTDASGVFPRRYSSLIRSNIITFASTAIPTVKIIPAILVRVRVKLNADKIATINTRFSINARSAIAPASL